MTAVTAHGVVPAAAELAGGAGAHRVELVAAGQIAALVTPAPPPEARPRGRDLLRHSEVLQEAVAVTTVLPLRFGTLFGSREELVEEFLRPRHDELAALLAELDGKVEMSFAASLHEEAVLRELVAANPEVAALREATRHRSEAESYPERVRLGELVAAGLERRRSDWEQRMLECVVPHVAATLLPEEPRSPSTIEASLLVAREGLDALEATLERFARDSAEHLEARLVGPLPPYSFVGGARPAEQVA
jgi:hypothetical protein